MYIIGLGGGLGNQMFQYAFYLSMKKAYPNCIIKLDVRYAFINEHNGVEIDRVFNVKYSKCNFWERLWMSEAPINQGIISRISAKVRKKINFHKRAYYKQPDYTEYYDDVYCFDPKYNRYLLGVWANEKYLKRCGESNLQEVLKFILPLNEMSLLFEEKIQRTNSVSIHVRKGDFVLYENHVMTNSYYEKAISYLEKIVNENKEYFIFSDDMEYAKQLFGENKKFHYVQGNEKKDSWMDMYLMSKCKHNIIANSSFSFWGAYLNSNNDKVVIAPNKPFKTCKNPFTCEGWILLDEE